MVFPCVLIAVFSAYYFGKTIFRDRLAACVTAMVFLLNTYFLRISTQGSVNLGTSIALAPLVLALLLRAQRQRGLRYPVLAGLAMWLQGTYDLRFCYLTIVIALAGWVLLCLGSARRGRQGLKEAIRWGGHLALSLGIFVGANIYWLLPNLLGPGSGLPSNYGEAWWIPFLGFGRLVHGLTLSDPGWPARTFMQLTKLGASSVNPFFVLIPLVGFGGALVALHRIGFNRERARIALAGCSLTLVGVFLFKGSNRPWGSIYIWLFNHIPGFRMFRDSNKMFLFVLLGYSILTGLAAVLMAESLSARSRSKTWSSMIAENVPSVVVLFVLCMLVLPALSGSLGGIFGATSPVKVPEGYNAIDSMLEADQRYYRTLWFPDTPRFAAKSPAHPAVSASELFSGELSPLQPFHGQLAPLASTENPMSSIKSPILPGLLDTMAVRMMVVPEELKTAKDFVYSVYANKHLATDKKEFELLAAALPGNSSRVAVGGSAAYTRSSGKAQIFVPERCFGVIGGWAAVIAADGAPGLDFNKSVYFLSQQGGRSIGFSKGYTG